MSRYLNLLLYTVVGLLVVVLGFAYASEWIAGGTLVFLGILVLTLGIVAVIFASRLNHPSESVEQMLYNNEHSTRT